MRVTNDRHEVGGLANNDVLLLFVCGLHANNIFLREPFSPSWLPLFRTYSWTEMPLSTYELYPRNAPP